MSIEGLWTSEFYGLHGWESSGVLVLENGRAFGGGRHHFSTGSYEISGEDLSMSIEIEYHGPPRTLFGSSDKKISLQLNGQIGNGMIEGSVFRSENPKMTLMFRLIKRADIP